MPLLFFSLNPLISYPTVRAKLLRGALYKTRAIVLLLRHAYLRHVRHRSSQSKLSQIFELNLKGIEQPVVLVIWSCCKNSHKKSTWSRYSFCDTALLNISLLIPAVYTKHKSSTDSHKNRMLLLNGLYILPVTGTFHKLTICVAAVSMISSITWEPNNKSSLVYLDVQCSSICVKKVSSTDSLNFASR